MSEFASIPLSLTAIALLGAAAPYVLAVLAALGVTGVGVAMRNSRKKRALQKALPAPMTVTQVVRMGRDRARTLRRAAYQVHDRDLRAQVTELSEITELIFAELERDPADIPGAYRFLDYTVDAAVEAVRRYIRLQELASTQERIQKALEEFPQLMNAILASFRQQHERLVSDDVLDFEVDNEVLRKMIEMEGA